MPLSKKKPKYSMKYYTIDNPLCVAFFQVLCNPLWIAQTFAFSLISFVQHRVKKGKMIFSINLQFYFVLCSLTHSKDIFILSIPHPLALEAAPQSHKLRPVNPMISLWSVIKFSDSIIKKLTCLTIRLLRIHILICSLLVWILL